ncbi:MAG: glycosyl hydrolase [bacterium]
MTDLKKLFSNPPVKFRPMLQWSWNDKMTEKRISEQLEHFAEQGAGGVFPHARPGCITEYLSDNWFELWDFAVKKAEELGIELHIYDEFICPSGTAGGKVTASNPFSVHQELTLEIISHPQQDIRGEPLAFVKINENQIKEVTDKTLLNQVSTEEPIYVLTLITPELKQGNFPGPDLLRKETTKTFIEKTHKKYARFSGKHFGDTVNFMFSDEPQIFTQKGGLPFSRFLLKEFRKDHDYNLEDYLLELCFNKHNSQEVRYDYYWTINRLFKENFMKPLHDWCQENDLLFTGHLMEHEWPNPESCPDFMGSLRWMQAPGNDLLGFQFEATSLENNGLYFLNLKELNSVKCQLGRDWTVVETCGGAGYESSFEVFKPLEDFTLAQGVNVIDPHLGHTTLAGIGKYDWAHTFSDHSPWWQYYRDHADHVARTSIALSQGEEYNRVLVLHPTTSAWLHHTGSVFNKCDFGENENKKLEKIKEVQINLLLKLYENQIDFDIGNEFIMEEFGRVEDGKMIIGQREYQAVVVPDVMENWNSSTYQLVREFLQQKGTVFSLDKSPERIDGRLSDKPANLKKKSDYNWLTYENLDPLIKELKNLVPPRIELVGEQDTSINSLIWTRIELPNNNIVYFFANPWPNQFNEEILLEGKSLKEMCTNTGEFKDYPYQYEDKVLKTELKLPARSHLLLLATNIMEKESMVVKTNEDLKKSIPLQLKNINRNDLNLLMLDYCDLEAYNQQYNNVNTIIADDLNWKLQGLDGNPWLQNRQFKRTIIDYPVDKDSEFTVNYKFKIGDDFKNDNIKSIKAGIERPWLYEITLNSQKISVENSTRWFDPNMRAVEIGSAVQKGENILSLKAKPFHMLAIIMPVYILGDFTLKPVKKGFIINNPERLKLGEWSEQGLPFYPAGINYTFDFDLDEKKERIKCQLGSWEGSVAVVKIDNIKAGTIMHPPDSLEIEKELKPGKHALGIEIFGNMKNMMGPHFNNGLPISVSWEKSPDNQPPGNEYNFIKTGLMEIPELFV